MILDSINADQRLYVIREGAGTSCYGFDVLDRKAKAIGRWLENVCAFAIDAHVRGSIAINPEIAHRYRADARARAFDWPALGTESHFARCDSMLDLAQRFCAETHERCPVDLCQALLGLEGRRVSARYFGEPIRFTVGKSTGWMPVHVRRHNSRSRGGEGLIPEQLTDVRVVR